MRHSKLQGTHFEVGRQWGEEMARAGILLLEQVPFPVGETQRRFARSCRSVYEERFPQLLEEIQGLAQGQGCPAEEVETVLFSMYALAPGCHCSCFGVRNGMGTLLGRNSDFWAALADRNLHVEYEFSDGGYAFTGNTTAFVEMEDGRNEKGLAAALTAAAGTEAKPGLNAGMPVRYCLERCGTVEEAVAALQSLPIASAQTITLADRWGGLAVVECAPQKTVVRHPRPGTGFVWAVNRFSDPAMSPYQAQGVDDWRSGERAATLERVLTGEWESMDPAKAQALLAGEYGFLCQQDLGEGKDTVWSVVYDLTQGESLLTEGNPGK